MNNDIKENKTIPPQSMSGPIVNPLPDLQHFFQPQATEVDIDKNDLCPIFHLVMRDPVVTCDGHTYEREAIEQWFSQGKTKSPLTNEQLKNKELIPNMFAKNHIDSFVEKNPALKDSDEWYLPHSWMTELQTACRTGDEKWIRRLAENDRRLLVFALKDEKDSAATALHFAAAGNPRALDTIIELLEKRQSGLAQAGLMQRNKRGQLPFHLALRTKQNAQTLIKIMTWMDKHVDRIEALKDLPAEFSRWPLNEALTWCIEKEDKDKIQCLRRMGAKPFNEAKFKTGLNYFFSEQFPLALPYFREAMQLDYPPAWLFSAIICQEDKSLSTHYYRQAGTHQRGFTLRQRQVPPYRNFIWDYSTNAHKII